MKPKTKIVLASLLKPVDDVRMYEKFGISLHQTGLYELHIVGFKPNKLPEPAPGIYFHPIFKFKRIGWKRVLHSWKLYNLLLKVKPDIIIANSHDLLIVTYVYKILFGVKLLYDVQENYYLNILHTEAFPFWLRPFLAGWVRLKEWMSRPFIHHYFLAEKVYAQQLKFIGKKHTIIENKCRITGPIFARKRKIDEQKPLKFLFSGTISRHYGVIEAIGLTNIISISHPVTLEIIGRSADTDFLQEIKALIKGKEHIIAKISDQPISHQEILEAIKVADAGIVSYLPNKSTQGRIPTKVFEYMVYQLPIIVLNDQGWLPFADKFKACVKVALHESPEILLQKLTTASFYSNPLPLNEISWAAEEEKLLKVIKSL